MAGLALALKDSGQVPLASEQQDPQQFYSLMKLKMNVLQQQLQAKQQLISIYEQQRVDREA